MTVEVEQVANALAVRTPVPVTLIYKAEQWHARCDNPPVETPSYDTMEQALIAVAQQITAEVQAAVIDQPFIIGKITPDQVPLEMFQ